MKANDNIFSITSYILLYYHAQLLLFSTLTSTQVENFFNKIKISQIILNETWTPDSVLLLTVYS